jgi:hypothetical protein
MKNGTHKTEESIEEVTGVDELTPAELAHMSWQVKWNNQQTFNEALTETNRSLRLYNLCRERLALRYAESIRRHDVALGEKCRASSALLKLAIRRAQLASTINARSGVWRPGEAQFEEFTRCHTKLVAARFEDEAFLHGAIESGLITEDEMRAIEDGNPVDGGLISGSRVPGHKERAARKNGGKR